MFGTEVLKTFALCRYPQLLRMAPNCYGAGEPAQTLTKIAQPDKENNFSLRSAQEAWKCLYEPAVWT